MLLPNQKKNLLKQGRFFLFLVLVFCSLVHAEGVNLEKIKEQTNPDLVEKKINEQIDPDPTELTPEEIQQKAEEQRALENPTYSNVSEYQPEVKKVENKKSIDKTEIKNKKDLKYSESIALALAPFQKLKESELLEQLNNNIKGSSLEKYFKMFPKFELLAIRLLRDKEALPKIVSISDDSDKFIRFIAVMVTSFVIGFIVTKIFKKEGRTWYNAFFMWIFRCVLMLIFRIIIVMYFYLDEFSHALKIIFKTIFE